MAVHRLHRVYDLQHPDVRVEIHAAECECPACAPALELAPYLEPVLDLRDRFTPAEIGQLIVAGTVIGNVIAFALHPHGAWAALLAIVGR